MPERRCIASARYCGSRREPSDCRHWKTNRMESAKSEGAWKNYTVISIICMLVALSRAARHSQTDSSRGFAPVASARPPLGSRERPRNVDARPELNLVYRLDEHNKLIGLFDQSRKSRQRGDGAHHDAGEPHRHRRDARLR